MSAQEIAFEVFLVALDSTRGTPTAAPTHYINMDGVLTPRASRYRPRESRGTRARVHRSKITRQWGEWRADGPLDVDTLPVLAHLCVGVDASPSTPAGATNARLWEFVPSMTSDDLKSASTWWGDPNIQLFKGNFAEIDELVIRSDAGSDDGATMSVRGMTQHPITNGVVTGITQASPGVVTSLDHGLVDGDKVTFANVGGMTEVNGNTYTVANKTDDTFELSGTNTSGFTAYTSGGTWSLAAPTLPSMTTGVLIAGADKQLWIDTSSGIGTTEITGRIISAEHIIPSDIAYKWRGAGPNSALTYTDIGVGDSEAVTRLTLEVPDLTQYNHFKDGDTVKLRVRHNGPAIETVSGTTFYNYVEFDIYGQPHMTDWGELEGTNRVIQLEVVSEYDSTLGAGFRLAIQNDNTSL